MTNYIGNYAISYAINRHIRSIQRNSAGTIPFYEMDMSTISIYATPAFLSNNKEIDLFMNKVPWESRPPMLFSFNSINTVTQLTEEARSNLPQIGRKTKQPPLNHFEFFAIGDIRGGIIRLGKKQVACRVYASPLVLENIMDGTFAPSHPININDLESFDVRSIENAELIKQTPPLLINARLKAPHYVCSDGKQKFFIAKPDQNKYPNVPLP